MQMTTPYWWQDNTFVDTALPFCLRSAPKLFSAFADALALVLHVRGVAWQLHYLDDFLFMGPPGNLSCARALQITLDTCSQLGVSVATHKTEGTVSRLTFLGIQIDTQETTLSLPEEKHTQILDLVLSWRSKQTASKRELQSLLGHLSHAAMVVLPGQMFLRRMIDLMKTEKHPSQHIRLTAGFRSDLHWWASFLRWWNGRSIMPPGDPAPVVTSDASGSWGCGALTGQWFQVQWPKPWAGINIAAKEMVPVVISVAIWGQALMEQHVQKRGWNPGCLLMCLWESRKTIILLRDRASAATLWIPATCLASRPISITPQVLRHIKNQWASHGGEADYMMLWAACCVFFWLHEGQGVYCQTGGRPSQWRTSRWMTVENPSMVRIHLKRSKTDPFRHEVDIYALRLERA